MQYYFGLEEFNRKWYYIFRNASVYFFIYYMIIISLTLSLRGENEEICMGTMIRK